MRVLSISFDVMHKCLSVMYTKVREGLILKEYLSFPTIGNETVLQWNTVIINFHETR